MSRILDERDKQEIKNNISTTVSAINQDIYDLETDMQETDTEIVNMLNNHKNNVSNPHKVTYDQVGADKSGSASSALISAKDYTDTKLAALIDSAPDALNTLNELADALGDDENFASTMTNELSKKTNNTDFASHTNNTNNPHSVTASQVGLGNVPNVTTNNQTPTFTEATTLASLVSGETMSVAFGKIMKAISTLISHLANKSNPHDVTKAQVGLGNADNTSDINKPVSTAQKDAIDLAQTTVQNNLNSHANNKDNPHSVTAHQVGAYTQEETDIKIADLVDSAPETLNTLNELSAALGDDPNFATTIANEIGTKATKEEFGEHINNVNNPHSITKEQVGLGDCNNTSDINKPVSTAQAEAIADAKKAGTDAQNAIDIHTSNKDNPHNVTISQIGADAAGSSAQALLDAKEYTDTEVSKLGSMASKSVVEKNDLDDDIKASLELADTALQSYTETDPTVPDWAKQESKPAYTASEVGALPISALPTITQEDEGKVLCVVNGAYSLVFIEDLLNTNEGEPGEEVDPEPEPEPDPEVEVS